MKLILCRKCTDVVRLFSDATRHCRCGKSGGRYEADEINAVFFGPCVPLGFDNTSLLDAIRAQPQSGLGSRFEAFVIPKECESFMEETPRAES